MRVRPADPHARGPGQVPQPPGRCVPVHPGAAAVEQDRSRCPACDRAVDRPPDSGRQRDEHDLGALAADAQHPVAVLLAQVGDVGAASGSAHKARKHRKSECA
jgi:hypothetical protein